MGAAHLASAPAWAFHVPVRFTTRGDRCSGSRCVETMSQQVRNGAATASQGSTRRTSAFMEAARPRKTWAGESTPVALPERSPHSPNGSLHGAPGSKLSAVWQGRISS